MVHRRTRHHPAGVGEGRRAITLHALRVRPVGGQAGEELRRHAAAAARIVMRTRRAGATAGGLAQLPEQRRLLPHGRETAVGDDVSGVEAVVDGERAGVDVTHRVDQAHHPARATHVQPGQRLTEGRQVEERVAGEHTVAVAQQPFVEFALLFGQRVQLVPHIRAASGRTQPGQPQGGAVAVGDLPELVELGDIVPGRHHRQLGILESGRRKVFQRPDGHVVGAGAAHRVVDGGIGAVERDLHVHIVAGGQPRGDLRRDPDAVGGELDSHLVRGGVIDQLPEVRPHSRFAAADIDVEDLHALELVDERLALFGAQLARIAPPRRRQAVHAGQIARVGEFPGQADRRGQAGFEAIHQPHGAVVGGRERHRFRGRGQRRRIGGADDHL